MYVVLATSSWSGECMITLELDGISVWHRIHSCTRRHRDRSLAWKVLCKMFYVEVEPAVLSVASDN